MNKHILIVDNNIGTYFKHKNVLVGGATIQTSQWIKGFINNNFIVSVVTDNDVDTGEGFKMYKEPVSKIKVKYARNIANWFLLLSKVKTIKPDYIYLSTAGINTLKWGLISFILKLVYLQRISNNIVFADKIYKNKLGALKYYISLTGANFVNIFLCQNGIQNANIKNLFPDKVSIIIPNPISHENTSDQVDENNYLYKCWISWIGIFQYQKNMAELYKIVKYFPNISFQIAGDKSNGIDDESLEYINKLSYLKNVKLLGILDRNDILKLLTNSICLLNTSRYEGYSNTFLEAFICGTPVVTLKWNDPDHIIETNKLGIAVNDYLELPGAIEVIIKTYKDYYLRNKQYVIRNNSPDKLVKILVELLNNN